MADTNWIKLNRKIWDNFIWSFEEPKYALAWIDMLLMANYSDKKIMFDGKVRVVQRGSFITSMLKLSERWGMNRRSVKNFLDMLQGDGMITYESTRRCTTVFISNYLAYQGFADFGMEDIAQLSAQPNAQQNEQQQHNSVHNSCTTDCTQHKKVKNIKEGKEGKEGEGCPPDGERPAPQSSAPYESIRNLYNDICKSFSRCTVMSESRKKAIKARLNNGYTWDDFHTLFTKAEASSFLKGKNDRNWTANFDWLIKDANMAKVLDGNYDDMRGAKNNGTVANDSGQAQQRVGNYV